MQRTVFNDDHQAFRKTIRDFIAKEVVPVHHDWEKQGHPPREFYNKLGELGVLGIEAPEEYGGGGEHDFTYSMVIAEECALAGVTFGSYSVHANLILPYLMEYATDEQKQRWLPGFCSGELMFAIAMTEPGTGSDLANISTTARLSEDGDHYILDGAKTFITGGAWPIASWWSAARRPRPRQPARRPVDPGGRHLLRGLRRGRKLEKIGSRLRHRRTVVQLGARAGDRPPGRRGRRIPVPHTQSGAGAAHHRDRLGGHRRRCPAACTCLHPRA